MGYAEAIHSDKTGIHIEDDEITRIQVEFCDRCQKWQSAINGQNQSSDGIILAWFCGECK